MGRNAGLSDGLLVVWISLLTGLMTLVSTAALATSLPTFYGMSSQFIEYNPKKPAPDGAFLTETGRALRLPDFKGQALLVNIWATWCAPCVREMPELERLQEDLGSKNFAVIAISIDSNGAAAVRPFFQRMGIDDLSIYLDPSQRAVSGRGDKPSPNTFPLYGLPISFFVDKQGILVGYLTGSADWGAAKARSFIRHLASER